MVVLYHYILEGVVTGTVNTKSAVKMFWFCFFFPIPGCGGRVVGQKEAKQQKADKIDDWKKKERKLETALGC